MSEQNKPDVFRFIINPSAGRRNRSDLAGAIEQVFLNLPEQVDYQILLTERPGHATKIAAQFAEQYGERLLVVACGGDGTAGEVAAGVTDTKAAMSILPIGTANDFVKSVFSTTKINELLPLLPNPVIRLIDTIQVDEQICLNITSLGFDTKVQLKAIQINKHCRKMGTLAYPLAIAASLIGQRSYNLEYIVDEIQPDETTRQVESSAQIILAAICNGRYYGGGFNPAPKAQIDDGRISLCLIDQMPLWKILPLIPQYKKGQHLKQSAVHLTEVTSGIVRAKKGMLLGNIDGEAFEREQIRFQVKPRSLYFACY